MKTRILNISPRAQLDIDDNAPGSYPPVLRSDDARTLGNTAIIFDDTRTQRYTTQTVLMPYNVSPALAQASGFLTGSIQVTKAPTHGSQFLTSFKEETYEPFNEARNPSPFFSNSDKIGTPPSVYPGFSSQIVDKMMISVDISTTKHKNSFKMISTRATNPSFQNGTGFMYYNFSKKEWEDIGLVDPATGGSTGYDIVLTSNNSILLPASKEKYLCQFTPSPGVAISRSLPTRASLLDIGYDKIGAPTAFFDAPNAPRYHATSSQAIKLSNYIQHPFVLEKLYVEMPIAGVRRHDPQPGPGVVSGSHRDIINHVFFIYRQNRSCNTVDTVADVSSSIRSIVANSSFAFFNAPSIFAPTTLMHNPDFSYNHALSITSAGVSVVTASYRTTFIPRIYDEMKTAVTQYPEGTHQLPLGVSHFWPGGTRNNLSGSIRKFDINPPRHDIVNYNDASSPVIGGSLSDTRYKSYVIDPRPLRSNVWRSDPSFRRNAFYSGSFAGGTIPQFDVGATTDVSDISRLTPYILFPEDELVIGIDSGFYSIVSGNFPPPVTDFIDYHNMSGSDRSVASITGSYLSILPGNARLCLYGSLIRDNIAKPVELNQNLTSDDIHEVVQEIIVDEFDISERILYSGSYLGNYITGPTNLSSFRGVVARASSQNTYPNFALNRFNTMQSITDTFVQADRTYPIVNFRYDHFGYNRDILEQRRDSKRLEISYEQNKTNEINFNKISSISSVDSPTICIFVSQSSETVISASQTRSSNLSNEFTCSLPFFDNTARNRNTITFSKNGLFQPTTIIVNKPSSLLSTT